MTDQQHAPTPTGPAPDVVPMPQVVEAPEPVRDALAWVSWLRVLAMSAVVVLHATAATATLPDAAQTWEGRLALVANRGGMFAVPVFVMVSGALLLDPERYRGDGAFLRRRAGRLLPAVLFWLAFYWVFKVVVLDQDIPPRNALLAALTGRLSTGLYFFWIVLGLAVVSPVLVAWVRGRAPRTVLVGAAVAAAIPVLGYATAGLRGTSASVVDTAWTWWIPFVGVYLAGRALSRTVVRGWHLAAWAGVGLASWALTVYVFAADGAPGWLGWFVGGYGSLVAHAFAVAVFLVARGALDRAGPARVLTLPQPARLARRLSDVTLGVFALHIAVLEISYRVPGLAGDPAAQTVTELVGRALVVLVVSYLLALALARVPMVRRLV